MNSTSSKKSQAFVVQPRSLFDYVATRDLTSIKGLVDSDPASVIDSRDEHGYSALHVAVAHGHLDICKAFLGIEDQNPSPFNSAANSPQKPKRSDSTDILAASSNSRKSRTASANTATKKDKPLAGNATLLSSQLPVPVKLPAIILNVNATTDRGHTPLHLAAMRGYIDIAKLLLEHGANPSATANALHEPFTAYQYARKFRHPEVEHLPEPLTFEGCKAITKDGSVDAAVQYVESVDPIQAAADGNVLYFALAFLDMCGDGAVEEAKYASGQEALTKIRGAVCPDTGLRGIPTCRRRGWLELRLIL